jgi:hypothetical protein
MSFTGKIVGDERLSAVSAKLRRARVFAVLGAAICCASSAMCLDAGDVQLSTLTPSSQSALNPCFSVRSTEVRLPNGTTVPATEFICGGTVNWNIPQGVASFHVTLWRTAAAAALSAPQAGPLRSDFIRVRVSLDGSVAADAVLSASTPPEKWVIPTKHARTLSIQMDEETGAEGLFLGDPGFSSQTVQSETVRHLLDSGSGYANLGTGPRQAAFHDFHPGETVPVQVEFAGKATRADVQLRISALASAESHTLSLPIALQPDPGGSVGLGQWQVPAFFGPATLELTVSVEGRQVYARTLNVALAKAVNLASVTQSNFGIHASTNGSALLGDDFTSLLGAKWVRFFLCWDQIESKQGQYDWQFIDKLVETYSAEHHSLLGVMGDRTPKWITDPDTQMAPAYAQFVKAALEHFRDKIHVWDAYNEINSKFYGHLGFDPEKQPNGDIDVLREEMQEIHRFDPSLTKVCCGPGGSDILAYQKRLFDAGLIELVDIVSMHPYQAGPPEESDNGLTYPEMVDRLKKLAASYGTSKPVWSTEANWLIGPAGTPGVFAPDVTAHEQSQYLVRVNLLSLGLHVPYFSHSIFFTPVHREVFVDALASYSAMTAVLSNAQGAKPISLPPHIYGITASIPAGTVAALWTDSVKPVPVHFSGLDHLKIQDMYGNPLPATKNPVLSGSPIYLIGGGNPVVAAAPPDVPSPHSLPSPTTWKVAPGARAERVRDGMHVTSAPGTYSPQLTSPILNVSANSCYVVMLTANLHRGGITVAVRDPDKNTTLRNEFLFAVTGNDPYEPTIRVKTSDDSHLQVVITDANPHGPAVSDFDLLNVAISSCP